MFSFNAEEEKEFDNTLPEAVYEVTIAEAEYKPSKSNPSNYMVALVYAINEGEFAGWKIYDNFNVINANDIAQRIGRSELKSLCESCDINSFEDPSELVGNTLAVKTQNKTYNGRTSPNVVGYLSAGENQVEIPFA